MTAPIDRYCVLGQPVEHSKSPWIHARFAELTGQQIEYGRQPVALDGFADAVRALQAQGARGCNVTVPFKFEAFALADARSAAVQLAQAGNTISLNADGTIRLDNTDGVGLVADLQTNAGVDLAGREVLLLGAGGAAAGVLGPLLQAAPRRIVLVNRTRARAEALAATHAALAVRHAVALRVEDAQALQASFDLVINATASSLGGALPPLPAQVLQGRRHALAVDLMYGPAAQPFLQWARDHGAAARDGLGMLVEQAAESFAIWRGVRPPSQQVLRELRATLSAA